MASDESIRLNEMIRDTRDARDKLALENNHLRTKLERLFTIVMRLLVCLKYLIRGAALVGCYYWLGKFPTIALFGFILLVAVLQLSIDKVQTTAHPEWKLSEWNL